MKEQVIEALKRVYDPEIPVNIYDLGLVYDIRTTNDERRTTIDIKMTMTSPTCPMSEEIMADARDEIKKIPGVTEINIDLIWDPPWDLSRMSEAARVELDLTAEGW